MEITKDNVDAWFKAQSLKNSAELAKIVASGVLRAIKDELVPQDVSIDNGDINVTIMVSKEGVSFEVVPRKKNVRGNTFKEVKNG